MVLSSCPCEVAEGIFSGCRAMGFPVSKRSGKGVGCPTCIMNVKSISSHPLLATTTSAGHGYTNKCVASTELILMFSAYLQRWLFW